MSKKLRQKIKDVFAAMAAVIILALVLSFIVAPLFPAQAMYIQFVAVSMMTFTGGRLVWKIVSTV